MKESIKKNPKAGRFATAVLAAVSALLIVIPGAAIIIRLEEYHTANAATEASAQLASEHMFSAPAAVSVINEALPIAEGASEGDKPDNPETETQAVFLDLNAMKEINPDTIGYVSVDDTDISFPVVCCEDPSKYLKTDYYGNRSVNGSVFADPESLKYQSNLVLYGHHMKSGAMFGALERFLDKEYADGHRTIRYRTDKVDQEYELCAVFTAGARDKTLTDCLVPYSKESMDTLSGFASERMAVDLPGFSWGDSLITLVTCEYTHKNGRLFVVGKLVRSAVNTGR